MPFTTVWVARPFVVRMLQQARQGRNLVSYLIVRRKRLSVRWSPGQSVLLKCFRDAESSGQKTWGGIYDRNVIVLDHL